jgi:nucleoside-diphosphate-sugar epimerase
MTPEDTAVIWVVGGGGLLGQRVLAEAARLGRAVYRSTVSWDDSAAAAAVLADDAEHVLESSGAVELYWCAGAGVVATGEASLREEVVLIETFVDTLAAALRRHPGRSLRVFLASSAGGVYAGSQHPPFSEETDPRPLSAYGEAKLAAEAALSRLSDEGVSVLIGRIANLYGPGQNPRKAQGIITQLCKAQLSHTPLSIYVSLDTARDYLFVRDAARMAVAGMALLRREPPGTVVTKILASHTPTTLAAIIGEIRRVTKRRPPLVLGTSPNARFQTRDLRFRSTVWPQLDSLAATPLPEGIAATMADVARLQLGPQEAR